ncbi:ABC transporter ATP-binding protein [uncultured Pseudokineococcus sp.]|uniref:ABC transporter ATP-binding protein n=1 Tax=uncultured Pseudokineococcus sp. TaxID=1642928 RepID=UPI002611EE41|nr:ABC transporter ATP-binding protein [uncultured Pseudokineococcus sp.]
MSEPTAPAPEVAGRRPTVVVDDLHVDYTVLAGGRRADRARGVAQRRGALRRSRVVHALRGVSFTAHEGESIGVVGHNGSGKSTLLRAVAGLATPTRGAVYADGQPTLLGVNAALINDLSGERNVILGGLALGMDPDEVRERYDDIVEFSGVGEAIDLPMATYSSGMGARLRFAIAASAEHRVLLVDEALAVGDAEFRRRSEQRIRELRERAGTVFLVSHSMGSIQQTCDRALWIDHGQLRADGPVDEVLPAYKDSTR